MLHMHNTSKCNPAMRKMNGGSDQGSVPDFKPGLSTDFWAQRRSKRSRQMRLDKPGNMARRGAQHDAVCLDGNKIELFCTGSTDCPGRFLPMRRASCPTDHPVAARGNRGNAGGGIPPDFPKQSQNTRQD